MPQATMSAVLLGAQLQALVSSLGIKENGATAQFDLPVELLPLLAMLMELVPAAPVASETTSFPRDRMSSHAGGGFAVRAPPPAWAKADPGQSIPDSRPAPLFGQNPTPTESLPTPQQLAAEKAANAPGKKTPVWGPDSGNSRAAASRRFYKMRMKRQAIAKPACRVAPVGAGACGTRTAAGTHQEENTPAGVQKADMQKLGAHKAVARKSETPKPNVWKSVTAPHPKSVTSPSGVLRTLEQQATMITERVPARSVTGRLRPLAEKSCGRLRSVGEWTRAVAEAAAAHEIMAVAVRVETAAPLGAEGAPAVQRPALAEIPCEPRWPHTRPTYRGASPTPVCALPGVPKETCPVAVVERKRAPSRMVPTVVVAHASLVVKPDVPCGGVQAGGRLDMPGLDAWLQGPGLDAWRAWLQRDMG